MIRTGLAVPVGVSGTLLVPASTPLPLDGQQAATVRVEENFRAEPNGIIVGRVRAGSQLPVTRVRGNWVETELEGWVWAPSLQITDRDGRDLLVSVPDGENLRAEPQGRVRARLEAGALLDELGRRPGWIRVRRVGWIWLESVELGEPARPAAPSAASVVPSRSSTGVPDRGVVFTVPDRGLAILAAPDGDTLGRAEPGEDVMVLARDGGWARVRLDGWVWLGSGPGAEGDSVGAPAAVDPEDVMREPDRYRGRVVTWRLQFVSLERAERVRTDFYRGEPFLLTRPAGGVGTFVYVAVPPERIVELEDLVPLEPIEVVGRIRSGASQLTGSPILDLVEVRRAPRR